jgi:transposase InsO family protein
MLYCVKCKAKTATIKQSQITTKNLRKLMKGECAVCGKTKSSFVNMKGSGFSINSFVNNLPIELHQFAEKGEDVPGGSFNNQQKYSFCGPGTKYEQRIREGYQGINELDRMCKLHDKFYNENTDTKVRNISDLALAHRADEIAKNPIYDTVQRKDANFISGIMKTKAKLGLGIEKTSWNEDLANELHTPVKRKFPRRHVISYGVDDVWSCDLVEMQEWSKQNKGYRYMLNVVDVFSKYAWSVKLLDKKGKTVLEAFKQIVKSSGRKPGRLWVDQGKEFYNKDMDEWIKENDIIRYSTYGEHKSAVVERFNRTLKTIMWKRFTAENTRNWIDMLDKLIFKYNNTVHSAIKMTPTDARGRPATGGPTLRAHGSEDEVAAKPVTTQQVEPSAGGASQGKLMFNPEPYSRQKPKFSVGDQVRISRIKGIFEKGYLPNWSEALYTIHKVKETSPITYILKDMKGEIVEGGFYTEELQKSKQEVFRIEKVLRKKKINGVEHGLVKWLGYDKNFNEWKPMSEIIIQK